MSHQRLTSYLNQYLDLQENLRIKNHGKFVTTQVSRSLHVYICYGV